MAKRLILLMVLVLWAGAVCFGDASAQLEQAQQLEQAGDYGPAEAIYKQVAAEAGVSDDGLAAQEGLAKLYIKWGKAAEADAACQLLIGQFSQHEEIVEVLLSVAGAYRKAQNYEKAGALYRHAGDNHPESNDAPDCRRGLAACTILYAEQIGAADDVGLMVTGFSAGQESAQAMGWLGQACARMRKYELARRICEYFVTEAPDSSSRAWARMGVGVTSAMLGDQPGAEAALEALAGESTGDPDAARVASSLSDFCRYLPASDIAKERKFDKVIGRLFKDFAGRDPLKAIDHMGDVYRDSDEYAKAAELFEYAAATWSESEAAIECQTNAVKAYAQKGDEPNATAAFERLIIGFWSSESIGPAVEQIADKYRDLGRAEQGYEKYKYVFEHWPGAERALWARTGMVMSRIRAWNLDAAEAELGSLLSEFGSDAGLPSAVHEIVEEYRNTGAHEESRELFAWLLDNWAGGDETLLELQVGVALQSIKLGELAKAESAVAKLITDYNENPKIAKALFQIAEEHFYKINYPQTIELLELIDSDYPTVSFPARSEVPYILATCHNRRGEDDIAVEYYKRTIEQYPNSRYAQGAPYRIAMIYCLEKQDPNLAVYWFGRQMELYPQFLPQRTLLQMATTYSNGMGDFAKGAGLLEQYIENYPESGSMWTALVNLAFCYEMLGDKPKAEAVLEQALDVSRNENLASYIRNRINGLQEGAGQ
jgi:tetratricopeptide (TPR) repeat protein